MIIAIGTKTKPAILFLLPSKTGSALYAFPILLELHLKTKIHRKKAPNPPKTNPTITLITNY